MANSGEVKPPTLPFHTSHVDHFLHLNRIHAVVYTIAILALFYHRFSQLCSSTTTGAGVLTSCLFLSDIVLAFMWVLAQAFRWLQIRRRVYPERLSGKQLPSLDVFICTADPYKEPPMGVVNTALSVMAYDYPTEKLSVYVSDDGGSNLTLYAFIEAARFARYWLPFCRENDIEKRSPEEYFRSNDVKLSGNFKNLYENMKEKVEAVMDKGHVDDDLLVSNEERLALQKWDSEFTRKEHPSVIQVLLENCKDMDITGRPLPNLIYVSREKKKDSPHQFKAGALNALIRVSSVMTNAPFVLTLDCDMSSNDPTTPHKAMCFLLDDAMAENLAFVQFPQRFRRINDSDLYGSEFRQLFLTNPLGMDGIRGPNYVGSNTFFRRRALHPDQTPDRRTKLRISSGEVLGRSKEVSEVRYENGTKWGSTVGFRYGSLVEDYYTGYLLQCEGWMSVFCDPERPAFVGDAPATLNDALSQARRWIVGLLEVGFSKHSPISFGVRHGSLLLGMYYSHYAFWGFWSIPIICYGVLPQIALAYQVPLFPKVNDPWFWLYIYLFFASYLQDLTEFLCKGGGTIEKWWNNQRMWLIRGVTCFPRGIMDYITKQMRFSTIGFNVTSKATEDDANLQQYEKGRFNFGVESPFVLSLGFFATTSLVGFTIGLSRAFGNARVGDFGLQILICGFVVVNCWPVYEGLVVRKDCGRIPSRCGKISVLMTFGVYFLASIVFRA